VRRAATAAAVAAAAIAVAVPATAGAAERRAADPGALRAAIAAARPGDVIVMRDGFWTGVDIRFDAAATEAAPVRLRAETPGEVVLDGSSRLTFAAPFLVAEGLQFRGGALDGSAGAVVTFASHHGRLTESAIIDYNPLAASIEYPWVVFEGDHNRVDRCYFRGKNHRRPVITNPRPGVRHNRVDGSFFHDITWVEQNGREIIQIMGYGMSEELGEDGAFFTVEGNLFEEAHGEGAEIISIKSNRNVIRHNTFRRTKGGVTNRSGNFNVIEGNFILGEKEPRSYGIRVTGRHQRVVNNYVAGVDGAGLLLVTGEYIDQPLGAEWRPIARPGTPLGRVPRYAQVTDGVFAHNTFVDCGGAGIEVGSSYRAGWPRAQQVLLPERNLIAANVVRQSGAAALRITTPETAAPLDRFQFTGNTYEANVFWGGAVTGAPGGWLEKDPLLVMGAGGLWRPRRGSPLVDGGARSVVADDVDGQPRRGRPDVGADETSTAKALHRPLTARDVGPRWLPEQPTGVSARQ
jgi:poly(beta-D-mannuronate) lyase